MRVICLKSLKSALALFPMLLVVGCSPVLFPSTAASPIEINSEPSGATVYAMGKVLGKTPLRISHKDVFPNPYPKEMESMYGKVLLKKEGCQDFTAAVSDSVVTEGLDARLICQETMPQPHQSSSASPQPPRSSSESPRNNLTIEQRLAIVKDLLNKKLITNEEAKKARERILNGL